MKGRQAFFHEQAPIWDAAVTAEFRERVDRDIVPRLGLRAGDRVLDAGCGTGLLLPMIQKRVGAGGTVTGLDYAEGMIAQARQKFGPNFTYVCAPADTTGLRGMSFDVVVCFNAFPHFPDKEGALKEFFRLLQRGGRLVIAHADSRAAINAFHAKIGGAVGGDMLPENDDMIAALRTAGFVRPGITDGQQLYVAVAVK